MDLQNYYLDIIIWYTFSIMSEKRKLLVVDDEVDICAGSQSFFGKRGFLVSTTGNGEEALSMIEATKPDLILLDLTLNYHLSGMDVLKKLRETDKETKVVIISANEDKVIIDQLYSLGISGFYKKPFVPEEIEIVVYEKLGIDPNEVRGIQLSGEARKTVIPKSRGSLHQISNKLHIIEGKSADFLTDSKQGYHKNKSNDELLQITVEIIKDVQDHTKSFQEAYEDSVLKQKTMNELLKMNVEYLNNVVKTVDGTMKILDEESDNSKKEINNK